MKQTNKQTNKRKTILSRVAELSTVTELEEGEQGDQKQKQILLINGPLLPKPLQPPLVPVIELPSSSLLKPIPHSRTPTRMHTRAHTHKISTHMYL